LDIELESSDSIRIKVFEDVRLKIGVNAPWDGSYRKAGVQRDSSDLPPDIPSHIDARYEGSIGKIIFSPGGVYELQRDGAVHRGRYTFLDFNGRELLEVRAEDPESNAGESLRETYLVSREGKTEETGEDQSTVRENLSLLRVRLGTRGLQELHEPAISLSRVRE
jgi:hypothetical protein